MIYLYLYLQLDQNKKYRKHLSEIFVTTIPDQALQTRTELTKTNFESNISVVRVNHGVALTKL